jgi:hypothetical protein
MGRLFEDRLTLSQSPSLPISSYNSTASSRCIHFLGLLSFTHCIDLGIEHFDLLAQLINVALGGDVHAV